MDWNFKSGSWDLTELQEESIAKIHGVDGLGSGLGDYRNKGEFSIDLKLGQVGNSSEELVDSWKQIGGSKMASSPSGSSKRARAASNGTQAVYCLVDGCDYDLSNCREYHRRHKVCEQHSKTPEVTIAGQRQRFCQQCSRFHSLEEFDEGKRSCRKRLDGHNRRRRKPQPEPMSHHGNFLPNYQGPQLLSFSNSHVYPSTSVVNLTWAGVVSTDADPRLYNQHQQLNLLDKQNPYLGSSSSSFKGGKHFSSRDTNNQTSPETSVCQPLLRTLALPETGHGSHNMFHERLTTHIRDSDCALSLLSSPQTHTSGISLNQMVHPLSPNLHDHSLESMDSILVSYDRDASDHCPGNFHVGSDVYSVNEPPQTLPFHWD